MTDAIFEPLITEEEVNLQKKIIQQELEFREYNTELDSKFLDYMMDSFYKDNTIGLKETPSLESLDKIDKNMILEFLSRHFTPERMSIVGINVPIDSLTNWTNNYFTNKIENAFKTIPSQNSLKIDDSIAKYTGGYSFVKYIYQFYYNLISFMILHLENNQDMLYFLN